MDASPELLAVFRDEVAETLDELAIALEGLRGDDAVQTAAHLEAAFRHAHNLKGAARMVGHDTVVFVTHAMEDVLSGYRDTGQGLPGRLVGIMLEALTVIARAVDGENQEAAAEALVAAMSARPCEAAVSPPRRPPSADGGHLPAAAPAAPEMDPVPDNAVAVAADADAAPEAATPAAEPCADDGPEAAPQAGISVRVELGRLDRLMGYTGELLLSHAGQSLHADRLCELSDELRHLCRELPVEARAGVERLSAGLDDLLIESRKSLRVFGYLTDEINTAMKRVRMLPLESLAPQWRRIVREAALETGRQVKLALEVGDIEVDKHVLDALRDPIMHLLRNAVGHGIEDPAQRLEAGKPPAGQVLVKARMRGSRVQISVSDDGRGIDPQRIANHALARGIIEPQTLRRLENDEVLELMFRPGFSTAESVSQLSGRGVGLDVVRAQVESLAGEVRIETRSDLAGATFCVRVPSSLVSDRGLLVQVGESMAVLNLNDVERVLLVEAGALATVAGETVLERDGDDSLIVRELAPILGEPVRKDAARTVVVVRHGRSRVGVLVCAVLGEERFVTKHLPWNLPAVAGVQGGVILPGGRVALVLDSAYLVSTRLGQFSTAPARMVDNRSLPRVMVVDDSVTSRTLQRNILQSAGYEVVVARDGEEGWQALHNAGVDLVVSDVEMPRCGGLELTGRIRGSDRFRELPVILVTSLGDEDHVAAGVTAGADEYIVKGRFDQRTLLESVARLI